MTTYQSNMNKFNFFIKTIFLIFIIFNSIYSFSQKPGRYFVYFNDKPGYASIDEAATYLSAVAIQRRLKQGISYNETDLPVAKRYIDSISNKGLHILYTSRWLNGAMVLCPDTPSYKRLKAFSFIKKAVYTSPLMAKKSESLSSPKFQLEDVSNRYNYGYAYKQVTLEHGEALHNLGYKGNGMRIAVIDGGFYHANQLPALDTILNAGRLLGAINFDFPTFDIYTGISYAAGRSPATYKS